MRSANWSFDVVLQEGVIVGNGLYIIDIDDIRSMYSDDRTERISIIEDNVTTRLPFNIGAAATNGLELNNEPTSKTH